MSSHREAPEISKDPVADSTDVYAFVSPDRPDTVTLIANYIPLEDPAGGPNFFEFGDDVLYRIHVSNRALNRNSDPNGDIAFEFRFTTTNTNPNSFLYNTGPINSLGDATWNRRQSYSVTRVQGEKRTTLARNVPCPPCNVGTRSTPNYPALAQAAITDLPGGGKVFAGQRLDGFWVDLGSIFDLGALRPVQSLHLLNLPNAAGVNAVQGYNVHTIALQLPISALTSNRSTPTRVDDPAATLGVWTSASRRKGVIRGESQGTVQSGSFTQVSRLGNPLINEVIIPLGQKDEWNRRPPKRDERYLASVQQPELAKLLPILYPGVFPNLAAYTKPRADLAAVLMTGIPAGVVPGFQNFTGPVAADMLRLNVAIPPSRDPKPLGLVGGDAAGFPNGRRVTDDVVTIELRAVAGATLPLVDPSFTPDAAAAAIADGTAPPAGFLPSFPYLGHPISGFASQPHPVAS
jgi:Domain of unknown function (DUF4331)